MAFATDDPMFAQIQKDINELEIFNNLLDQGQVARFGQRNKGS